MAEDSELWDVICDGPYVLTKVMEELPFSMPKTSKDYTDVDRKDVEKNFRAKNILVCGIGPEEYNRISACDTAKDIWEALQTAHEETTQVKQSKIDMLTIEYELFRMKDDESIQDMHTRFTSIINELHSLGADYRGAGWKSEGLQDEEEDRQSKKRTKERKEPGAETWGGGSSSESEDETEAGDSSMMAVEGKENEYDSTFALMAQSDDDEDENNKDKKKEIVSKEHTVLENELKAVRTSMCVETEKNKHLLTDMERVKNDLEKFLKWSCSSETITAMYTNNGVNRQGMESQREKTPYNPHSKYVLFLITGFVPTVGTMITSKKIGIVKGSSQQWFMDRGYSKHMTGNTMEFLSLKALQGGSVSFGNGKKGTFLELEKSGSHLLIQLENVYYVNSLKYSLLSVSQICDKGNKVEFLSKICTVTDLVTGKVILVAKRYKNIYL
ncbi:uncharacterized protein [Nicotiana sylvestris]|uniref:uncharacterized protein n=1 Tax=Nicotiana sylvestris TaxID=4096 RepID=UPI00388C67CE